jgi:hypothetical protein
MTPSPGRTQSGIQSAAIINTAPNNTLHDQRPDSAQEKQAFVFATAIQTFMRM